MKHCNTRSSGVQYLYFDHSSQLPKIWDDFLPEDHDLKKKQLLASEAAALPDISFLYLLVTNQEQPIIAISFQVLKFSKEHLNELMVKPYQYFFWKLFLKLYRPTLLVSGHLFRHDVDTCYHRHDINGYEAYLYHSTALEKTIARTRANAALIKDLPSDLGTYFQRYKREYTLLKNDISMDMEIPAEWETIDDYEAALKHKYAQRFRKIRKPWRKLTIKEFTTEELFEHKKELYDLYKKVTDHQQVRIGFISEDFLPELKKSCGPLLKVWGIYNGDQLLAFFSAWNKEEVFDMFYIGFDYDQNKKYSLYFNILFFSIEQAIKLKKQKLILGRTALDAKARLGCVPRYLPTYLYVRNSFLRRRVAKAQISTSENEGAWEQRHPFRKQND